MSEDKVVRPLAEELCRTLYTLWTEIGSEEVTYRVLATVISERDDLAHSSYRSCFHIGRALNYAKRKGWVDFQDEILWEQNYHVAEDLVLTPGPASDWEEPRQIELATP